MLIKHNTRTARNGCSHCGTQQVYGVHDTDLRHFPKRGVVPNAQGHALCKGKNGCGITSGRIVWVDAVPETTAIPLHGEVPDRFRHASTCPARKGNGGGWTGHQDEQTDDAGADEDETTDGQDETTTTTDVRRTSARDTLVQGEALAEQVADVIIRRQREAEAARNVRPGAHKSMPRVQRYLTAEDNVMMVGPAGTGKTTLGEQCADAMGLTFASLSLTAGTMPSQIIGAPTAHGTFVRTPFREAFEHGGLFLFDEIDNGHPNTVGLVNQALANGHMSFADGMVSKHPRFRCMAAANTYGRGADGLYVGRTRLDAATLDRFAMITVDIDEDVETAMCKATGCDGADVAQVLTFVRRLRANASARKLPVVISPRASKGMCAVMALGETFDDAAEARLFKGMTDDARKTLTA